MTAAVGAKMSWPRIRTDKTRTIAFFEIEQLWDARRIETRDGDSVRFGDLVWVRHEDDVAAGPDDDRRDPEPRACGVVVEKAKHAIGVALQAHFLVELPQRRASWVFAVVDTASRKRPLSAVVAKTRHAARDDEARVTAFVGDDGHGHGSGSEGRVGFRQSLVSCQVCGDLRAESVVGPKHHSVSFYEAGSGWMTRRRPVRWHL